MFVAPHPVRVDTRLSFSLQNQVPRYKVSIASKLKNIKKEKKKVHRWICNFTTNSKRVDFFRPSFLITLEKAEPMSRKCKRNRAGSIEIT